MRWCVRVCVGLCNVCAPGCVFAARVVVRVCVCTRTLARVCACAIDCLFGYGVFGWLAGCVFVRVCARLLVCVCVCVPECISGCRPACLRV